MHSGLIESECREIMARQQKAVRKARRESKYIPTMLFVLDDMADDRKTMGCQLVRELLMKGRHSYINTALSSQKWRALNLDCRMQLTGLAVFRCRSARDWDAIKEENSGAIDPHILQEMYELAISDPYGFLFINSQQGRYFRSFKSELKAS